MHRFLKLARWSLHRIGTLAIISVAAIVAWSGRRAERSAARADRAVLPSLYDRFPMALRAPRRRLGLRSVSVDRIVGTMRHPSQNTVDFLPLADLRGQNWRGRWQRIGRATDRLEVLPPIDVMQVGADYYVEDGHNRVAAARRAGALEIDADVTQLLLPDAMPPAGDRIDATAVAGGEELRQAAAGRHSRTVEQRTIADVTSRAALVRCEAEAEPEDAP